MNPDVFEVGMLVCFGASWPFSIYKLLKTKNSEGKSVKFLVCILLGYVFGMLFEFFGERDAVIFLYILNCVMISADLALTVKYTKKPV